MSHVAGRWRKLSQCRGWSNLGAARGVRSRDTGRPLSLDRYGIGRAWRRSERGNLERDDPAEEVPAPISRSNYPWTYDDAPLSPPKRLANPSAAMPELKSTNKTTSAPFLPQSNLVGSHRLRSSHSRIRTISRARSRASTRTVTLLIVSPNVLALNQGCSSASRMSNEGIVTRLGSA
jgi:hypothetical protein